MEKESGGKRLIPIQSTTQGKSKEYAISLRVNIAEIRKTAMVNSIGRAETYSKVITPTISDKDMVRCIG
jgi:uncharacterized protein YjdB